MKAAVRLLLAVSLIANTALGVTLLIRGWSTQETPTSAPIANANADALDRTPPDVASATTSHEGSIATQSPALSAWQRLRDESDRDFVGRLEAEGFPRATIRAIIQAEVTARFAERRRELERRKDKLPWWQSDMTRQRTPEIRQAERALQREIDDVIGAALGTPIYLYTEEEVARAVKRYGDLPLEKLTRLQEIERDYSDVSAMLRAETDGVMFPEDRERQAQLELEKRRDFADVLTAEEIADFDRRSSPRAARLRNQLQWFEATEAEYLALYDVWKQFDERTNLPEPTSRETSAQRQQAERELEPLVAAVLGEKRFAEYELAQQPAMRRVRPLTDKFGLPREAAFAAVRLEKDFTPRIQAARGDPAATAILANEANMVLEKILGPEAFNEYREGNTGRWLLQLQRRRPPQSQ